MSEGLWVRVRTARWFDPALAAGLIAICLIEWLARPDLARSAAIVLVLLGAPIAVRRTHPLAAAGFQAIVFMASPDIDDHFLPDTYLVLTATVAYSCGAHASRRSGFAGVAVLVAAMQIGAGFAEFPNVELALGTVPAWWVGIELRSQRALVAAVAERNRELENEEDAFARLSVRRERARIAHELHDIVSHHLAVIVVQAGAGRMTSSGQPAGERLASIRESGGEALAEMARLLDVLHADAGGEAESDRLRKVRVLVDTTRAQGLDVRFTAPDAYARLPAEVEEGAYRVVQEGLTNVLKHAPGAEVHVRLLVRDGELHVEVRDTGGAGSDVLTSTGSGLGLTGMRDRVGELGGTVEAGPEPGGGWSVRARLPLAAAPVIPTG